MESSLYFVGYIPFSVLRDWVGLDEGETPTEHDAREWLRRGLEDLGYLYEGDTLTFTPADDEFAVQGSITVDGADAYLLREFLTGYGAVE